MAKKSFVSVKDGASVRTVVWQASWSFKLVGKWICMVSKVILDLQRHVTTVDNMC